MGTVDCGANLRLSRTSDSGFRTQLSNKQGGYELEYGTAFGGEFGWGGTPVKR